MKLRGRVLMDGSLQTSSTRKYNRISSTPCAVYLYEKDDALFLGGAYGRVYHRRGFSTTTISRKVSMHLVDALHVRSFLLEMEAKEASMYRSRYPETNLYRLLPF